MNLPNKLTCIRIALVPVCLLMVALQWYIVAAVVFAAACLTDLFDGMLARKNGMVTNFGKFADPIADKVLTVTMMICMAAQGLLPVWLPVIVVMRELIVDGLRLIAMEKGRVVAAGWSGKVKTVMQMTTILLTLLGLNAGLVAVLSIVVCILTVYSGVEYFYGLRDLFKGDFGA